MATRTEVSDKNIVVMVLSLNIVALYERMSGFVFWIVKFRC